MSDSSEVRGVVVPVITPVDDRDRVDPEGVRGVIRHCIEAGAQGIFVGGSAGMGPLLADAEWQRLMETAIEEVGTGAALLAGVMATSTARALDRVRVLQELGCRHVVVTPTFYITLKHANEFTAHFEACAGSTDMDMIVYNIPSCTGSAIPPEVVLDLARRGLTSVCKESSGDRAYFERLVVEGRDAGLTVLQGNEPDMAWALELGAGGIVPVCANYEPATFVTAWQAAQAGDRELLARAQERILEVRRVMVLGVPNWVAGVMSATATLGFGSGRPVAPLDESAGVDTDAMAQLAAAGPVR